MHRVFLLYFEWPNTSGNHAGMAYLCKQLELNNENIKAIKMLSSKSKLLRIINLPYSILLVIYFLLFLNRNDKVFLMEYMARGSFQSYFAMIAAKFNKKFQIIGLVHLSGNHLIEIYKSKESLNKWLKYPDKIMVLGSSLADFIHSIDSKLNVITTYHYVDNEFYRIGLKDTLGCEKSNKSLQIICIGNIKRDYYTLKKLIASLPEVTFHICQGMKDLSFLFSECSNVHLYGYMSENQLLELMQSVDVGLSIMEDTVGSNVITTSMACALVQIVSDVGSIHDYCTENDSFFCKSLDDFKRYIELVDKNRVLLNDMKKNALNRSIEFSLFNFINFFNESFCNE